MPSNCNKERTILFIRRSNIFWHSVRRFSERRLFDSLGEFKIWQNQDRRECEVLGNVGSRSGSFIFRSIFAKNFSYETQGFIITHVNDRSFFCHKLVFVKSNKTNNKSVERLC